MFSSEYAKKGFVYMPRKTINIKLKKKPSSSLKLHGGNKITHQ